MKRAEIFFSVKQAIHDPFVRWATVGSFFLYLVTIIYFIWSLLPIVRESGLIVLHYNTYLGIDAVRPWPWFLLFPAVTLGIIIFDTIASILLFQKDRTASRSIIALEFVTVLLWSVGMYFLVRINL
ncbi:MAG: hypothetical protein NUV81_04110 [bacterium]|nr:hypothetical protein [bacterium]